MYRIVGCASQKRIIKGKSVRVLYDLLALLALLSDSCASFQIVFPGTWL